jgi:hypothetical protein
LRTPFRTPKAMTVDDDLASVADALASAIATLAAVSRPPEVATAFRRHVAALALASGETNAIKAGRLDAGALID